MKKLLLNALCLGFVIMGFSQPAFTEQMVQDLNKKFIADPNKAIDENYLPSYVYYDRTGNIRTVEELKKQHSFIKHLTWETSDMAIKQNGTLAIVTGMTKHSYINLKDNSTTYNHVRNLDNLKKRIAAGKQNYARFDRKIENITFNDNLAIVMGEEQLEPQGLSENAGKTLTRRFTNIWKQTNGNWRMIARQATIIKVE